MARGTTAVGATTCILVLVAGCASMAGPIDVSHGPEFAAFAPVPADSVREVDRPIPSHLDDWLPDTVGAPYQRLALVSASNAGSAEAAKREIRKRIAQMGGNLMVGFDERRHATGPYTGASAFAVRALPPMPDAAERCHRLDMPDSALARVVACREAGRQDRASAAWPGALVVASLARAEQEHGGFLERFGDGKYRNDVDADAHAAAGDAIRKAWKDDAGGLSAPWVDAVLHHYHRDSVRAFQVILAALNDARRHEVARAYLRVAPDSLEGYTGLTGHACADGRVSPDHAAALRVLATYVRRRPDDHRGWVNAAIRAHALGDEAREAGDEARGTEHHARAMRYWERALVLNPRYFSGWDNMAPGRLAWQHWRRRLPGQPPATTEDLPPDCEEVRVRHRDHAMERVRHLDHDRHRGRWAAVDRLPGISRHQGHRLPVAGLLHPGCDHRVPGQAYPAIVLTVAVEPRRKTP